MKKILMGAVVAAGLITTGFTLAEVLPIGGTMPKSDLKLRDVSGSSITMAEVVKKNGVLVMFSCNTCPYVIKNQKRTVAIGDFAQKMGVGVIILNSNEALRSGDDSFEEMKSYAKEQKYSWSYAVDKNHEIADAFGANRTPECFLFDKNLKLVYHGAIDDNPSDESAVSQVHLKNAIEAVAGGKEVAIKETKSVGCTIKRNK